jgi:hypothetical protein
VCGIYTLVQPYSMAQTSSTIAPLPSSDQMKTICKNVARVFSGSDAVGAVADKSDKKNVRFSLNVKDIGEHSICVTVSMDSDKKVPLMTAFINIGMRTTQVHSSGYKENVVFPVLIYIDQAKRILLPALLDEVMTLDDRYIRYKAMIYGIGKYWLPILDEFEKFKEWECKVTVTPLVRGVDYEYSMEVVCDKNVFSYNRYINLRLKDEGGIIYWTGKSGSEACNPVVTDLLSLGGCVSKYLNTWKYYDYGSRYEAGHTRILELIDRF